MTYCVRVITRLCFFFVFSLFFLCFQMHCASIYSSFLLFLSCVDLELWYFSLQSQLWQPFVNQISNLGIYHFWNCSHLALHLPPCIDFPLLNNVLIHTEENFYGELTWICSWLKQRLFCFESDCALFFSLPKPDLLFLSFTERCSLSHRYGTRGRKQKKVHKRLLRRTCVASDPRKVSSQGVS